MHRKTPLATQLHTHLYPHPTPNDPPNFSAHLARHLVPEVRIEVATFYGDLSTTESRYPGLSYTYPPHRMRLGRFKHHRRLFEAFDALGLTEQEVQDFCCWEGTLWARRRFERDEGCVVRDTTGEGIGGFVEWGERKEEGRRAGVRRMVEVSVVVEQTARQRVREQDGMVAEQEEVDDEGVSDVDSAYGQNEPTSNRVPALPHLGSTIRHYRQRLSRDLQHQHQNQTQHRLPSMTHFIPPIISSPAATITARTTPSQQTPQSVPPLNPAMLSAWEQGQSLPEEIEQYLKDASERGTLDQLRSALQIRAGGAMDFQTNPLPLHLSMPEELGGNLRVGS